MAGAGAAVVALPGAAAPAAARAAASRHEAAGSLVAYVADVRGHEVSIMVGEREVVVRDRDLIARLVGMSRSSGE